MVERADPPTDAEAQGWLAWIAATIALFIGYLLYTVVDTAGAGRPGAHWYLAIVVVLVIAGLVLPAWAVFGLTGSHGEGTG